ncbi:MAG TPA: hypothetical protein VNA25_23300, partial [Phycisphaerae bacterium]|nr:hypothetical protein [Phycisphaerae bacterium]
MVTGADEIPESVRIKELPSEVEDLLKPVADRAAALLGEGATVEAKMTRLPEQEGRDATWHFVGDGCSEKTLRGVRVRMSGYFYYPDGRERATMDVDEGHRVYPLWALLTANVQPRELVARAEAFSVGDPVTIDSRQCSVIVTEPRWRAAMIDPKDPGERPLAHWIIDSERQAFCCLRAVWFGKSEGKLIVRYSGEAKVAEWTAINGKSLPKAIDLTVYIGGEPFNGTSWSWRLEVSKASSGLPSDFVPL